MDRCIGLDAHASSCTLGVVSPGGRARGPKDDRRDAFGLADALRLGAIARQIASIMLAVWRSGQLYDPLRWREVVNSG